MSSIDDMHAQLTRAIRDGDFAPPDVPYEDADPSHTALWLIVESKPLDQRTAEELESLRTLAWNAWVTERNGAILRLYREWSNHLHFDTRRSSVTLRLAPKAFRDQKAGVTYPDRDEHADTLFQRAAEKFGGIYDQPPYDDFNGSWSMVYPLIIKDLEDANGIEVRDWINGQAESWATLCAEAEEMLTCTDAGESLSGLATAIRDAQQKATATGTAGGLPSTPQGAAHDSPACSA